MGSDYKYVLRGFRFSGVLLLTYVTLESVPGTNQY